MIGEPQVQIAEIFIRKPVARIRLDRRFERGAGLFVATVLCIQRGEIVVRLGQFGVSLRQFGELEDGVVVALIQVKQTVH